MPRDEIEALACISRTGNAVVMEQKRLVEIDASRGVAAQIAAFVFHVHHLLGEYRSGPLDGLPLFRWLHEFGYTVVDLFFVISGFILADVYLADRRMTATARDFRAARIARLYPLHLVMLVVAAAVLAVGEPATVKGLSNDTFHFILNLLMMQETGVNDGLSFNGPAWCISVEVICYILFYLAASRRLTR